MEENFTKEIKSTKKETFTFSLINTKQCNFACSYCYEQGNFENKEYSREDIEKIYDTLKLNNARKISLMIIGGEPTLSKHTPYLFELILKNAEKDNIEMEKIVVITNGYSFKLIKNFFSEDFLNKYQDKIQIQISYDGKIIQDKFRVIKKGDETLGTSSQVLKTIEQCLDFGFDTVIKSTLSFGGFEYVSEVLKELRDLNLYYQNKYNDKKIRFYYAVTEVKESIDQLPKDFIQDYLKKYMPMILQEELINIKTFGAPLTKWLRDAKYNRKPVDCQAGINLFSINTELEIEYCHHASYLDIPRKDNKMIYGKITDISSFDKLKETKAILSEKINNKPQGHPCEICEAVYCLKCPIHNYEQFYKNRDQNNFDNLFQEFESDSLCFYYKELSKYLHAFNKKVKIF